jgi:hypothetical protein
MLDKAVTDGLAVPPGRSVRTIKMNFTKPHTFEFFLVFKGQMVHAWCWIVFFSPSDSPHSRSVEIYIALVRGVADGPPEDPGRSTHR